MEELLQHEKHWQKHLFTFLIGAERVKILAKTQSLSVLSLTSAGDKILLPPPAPHMHTRF